jgi:short-subunit dehydrogenase
MKLEGKVMVITGGGNGIGRELVLQSLARGARVAAVDLRGESLEQLRSGIGTEAGLSTHVADITDRARVAALPDEVATALGAVDGLINNAGIIQPFVRIAELSHDTIDRLIDVNLHGTLNMVQAFLPVLLERPQAHVANLSSMGGFLPVPGQSLYCATKAAVKLLTEGLHAELAETNVGVSVAMPGAIGTDITTNSGVAIPAGADPAAHRTTTPADAARTILDGIERGRLYVLPGPDARLMSVAMRVAPRRTMGFIQKQMRDLLAPSRASDGSV